jgi:hypothetical protein
VHEGRRGAAAVQQGPGGVRGLSPRRLPPPAHGGGRREPAWRVQAAVRCGLGARLLCGAAVSGHSQARKAPRCAKPWRPGEGGASGRSSGATLGRQCCTSALMAWLAASSAPWPAGSPARRRRRAGQRQRQWNKGASGWWGMAAVSERSPLAPCPRTGCPAPLQGDCRRRFAAAEPSSKRASLPPPCTFRQPERPQRLRQRLQQPVAGQPLLRSERPRAARQRQRRAQPAPRLGVRQPLEQTPQQGCRPQVGAGAACGVGWSVGWLGSLS